MKIHIHSRRLVVSLVLLAWLIPLWLTAFSIYNIPPGHLFFTSLVSSFLTLVVFAIYSPASSSGLRHKRIEKLLRQLEDEDLDLLRARLSPQQESEEDEYEALEASLNPQKRKNR